MAIKKTSLEIKQDRLIKKWEKSKKKPKRKVKKKKYKTKTEYYKELKDKRWLKKREVILKLDNYQCRHCGNTKNLVVHHKTYIKNRKAWQYPNELLMTLCKSCHHEAHKIPITKF